MTQPITEPITVRTPRQTVLRIDALAAAMDRSRNYIVNQAIERYLESNAWQVARIMEGVEAAYEGRVQPANDVLSRISDKHGWPH